MTKKVYVAPAVEVITFDTQCSILSASRQEITDRKGNKLDVYFYDDEDADDDSDVL